MLVNRPLNAIVGEDMTRLADFPVAEIAADLDALLRAVRDREDEFRRELAPAIEVRAGSDKPDDFFRWGEQLDGVEKRAQGFVRWQQIENGTIVPQVTHLVGALDRALTRALAERWRRWRDAYLPELRSLLAELARRAVSRSQATSDRVTTAIDAHLPAERSHESLSRKSLWVVASTPGVSAVLNGMRTVAYVWDATGTQGWPPLADPRRVYDAVRPRPR